VRTGTRPTNGAACKCHRHEVEVPPHGLNNSTADDRGLTARAERALVERALDMTQRAFGRMPLGYMVPNWSMSEATFEILLAAGVRYTTDWMNDDQLYWYELRSRRLLNVPYNLETNDYTLVLTSRLPGPELARAVKDHLDQLWRDGHTHGRSMAIGIRSFISGQPLLTRYVREIPRAHEGHEPHVARHVGRDLPARRAPRVTLVRHRAGSSGPPCRGLASSAATAESAVAPRCGPATPPASGG